jgi:hypothetical protein
MTLKTHWTGKRKSKLHIQNASVIDPSRVAFFLPTQKAMRFEMERKEKEPSKRRQQTFFFSICTHLIWIEKEQVAARSGGKKVSLISSSPTAN